jgi:uncharacterized membrane protein YkvA (DUF1232 family)
MAEPTDFSDDSFWSKLKNFALAAGKEVIEKALTLYYCYQDPDTPKMVKVAILGALTYFISPFDAVPDITPLLGYADDLGVLAATISLVAIHIKPEHVQKARAKIKEWFGD